jgi:ABC-type molybdate transport system substrate-binding protein
MNLKDLPVIPPERADDLHHLELMASADLVLFMAGNQFMVMPEIVAAFKKKHPQIKSVFFETLPPGLELKQIQAGGAVFRDKVIDIQPDIYSAVNLKGMKALEQSGHIDHGGYTLYLHNRLTLMVPAGNPAVIESVEDLAKDRVRISQPDPRNEDIAFHIMDMYEQAGGKKLLHRIMVEKRSEGTTIFTIVHHRETPLRISKKTVDVGPVWATEAFHAKTTDLPFDVIEPGETLDQRSHINYYICRLKQAPHPENARAFLDFITSSEAQQIYAKFGFLPHSP